MARVTVEDCIKKIPSRFDLVLLSAKRAREISAGSVITVLRDNDKNPVVALREIAEESIDLEALSVNLIKSMQRSLFTQTVEEEIDNDTQELILEAQTEWDTKEDLSDMNFDDSAEDPDLSV